MTGDLTPEAVTPAGHSKPVGRYSPGVRVPLGDGRSLLFISGQVASDERGRLVGGDDPAAQAEAVFARMREVLRAAGGELRHLVSVTIYLTDLADFPAVSAVRDRLLGDPPPSSTLVEVSRLVEEGRRVEVSGIAVIPGQPA